LGNAVIASYRLGELSPWEVVTDAGTTLRLDEAELDELFWPPSWVMDVATSPGIRARAALAQPEPVPVAERLPGCVHERFEFSVFDSEVEEQAGGAAPTYAQALSEGQYYLAMYSQDGPHSLELRRVEVLITDALPVPATH
jgi:hypothetical protein